METARISPFPSNSLMAALASAALILSLSTRAEAAITFIYHRRTISSELQIFTSNKQFNTKYINAIQSEYRVTDSSISTKKNMKAPRHPNNTSRHECEADGPHVKLGVLIFASNRKPLSCIGKNKKRGKLAESNSIPTHVHTKVSNNANMLVEKCVQHFSTSTE